MVRKEKDDFLAAQGFAAAKCLIRVTFEPFSFCPPNDKVKKVIIEKEEPGNPNNMKGDILYSLCQVKNE